MSRLGRYFPVITLPSRRQGSNIQDEVLEIQVSLPSTIFGHSLYGVIKDDLDIFCDKLVALLAEVGITTTKEDIKKGILKRVDFCLIIRLPNYLGTADQVIYKIRDFNYKWRSDFNFNQNHPFEDKKLFYGREGLYIKFCNSTQGYAIYDKFWEIYCNGHTTEGQKIKKLFEEGKLRRNALKFEFSLHHKQNMEAFLRRRIDGKNGDFTLENVLDVKLARGIMLDVFEAVFGDVAVGLITLAEMEQNRLYSYLDASGLSLAKQQKLFYWVNMATKNGVAGVWEQVKMKCRGGSVDTNKKEISLILIELGKISGNTPNLIDFLRSEHKKFEIIRHK